VTLDIEVGGVERLPDAVEVWLSVGRARGLKGLASRGLAACRQDEGRHDNAHDA
jgi:hypothetical protein